jgi:hypothetical protein
LINNIVYNKDLVSQHIPEINKYHLRDTIYGYVRDDDNNKKNKIVPNPVWHLELIKSGQEKGIPLNIGKAGGRAKLVETKDGAIIVAGYYYETLENLKARIYNGIFSIKVDRDGNIIYKTVYEFPSQYLTQRENDSKGKKKLPNGYDLYLYDVLLDSDGGLSIIGENFHYFIRREHSIFFHEEIFITRIDANGKISWMKKIPKRQKGHHPFRDMSFEILPDNRHNYFLYVDNVKNLELPPTELPAYHFSGQGGFIVVCKVDNLTGDMQKFPILDIRRVQGIEILGFTLDRIIGLENRSFFMQAFDKEKKNMLIKVELDSNEK